MTTSPMRLNRMRRILENMEESIFGFSFGLNRGLFDQHDRDAVPDRIDAVAADAFQALLVFSQLNVSLAERAGQNGEKLRV